MSKIRTAVVGVGHLGRFHAQKYAALENSDLVGLVDSRPERLKEVCDELKTEGFSDVKDLVGKVDAVTIATNTPSHFEIASFLMENGIHVNVEKPMTVTTTEAKQLCDLAEKNSLVLQVGHVERFNPALLAAREKLKSPLFIECHRLAPFKPRSMDVSVVLDLMIHDLDVILSLVKSEPVSVSAIGTPVLTSHADIANARIEFASGCVANVTASRVSQRAARKFRVFQPSQYLSIDFGTGEVNLLTKTGELTEEELPLDAEAWNLEKGDALLDETAAFLNSIANNEPAMVTGQDGMKALELAEMISRDLEARLKKMDM